MRKGSIAEVTGIMVNSGTMMKAKCCGRICGLAPNMGRGVLEVHVRHFRHQKRHFSKPRVASVPPLSEFYDGVHPAHAIVGVTEPPARTPPCPLPLRLFCTVSRWR